jgi:hypothetical protein
MLAREGNTVALGVARKPTLVGGFELDMSKLPAKPSGRTGSDGDLLKPEMADAGYESHRLYFELQHMLTTIGEDLHGDRNVVADERIKAMMQRLGDLRKYVQVLAQQNLVPFQCPRCQAEKTDDAHGDRMCAPCVGLAYGKARL